MTCNGVCNRYKVSRGGAKPFYSADKPDHKYCSTCDVKMCWPESCCPCCYFKLRTKARNGKAFRKTHIYPEPIPMELAIKIRDG